jgi:hypothetical protein
MGPQDTSTGQPRANSLDFLATYRLAYTASQQAQNAWRANYRNSRLALEAYKNIPAKERALQIDYAVGPFGTYGVERKVVLQGAGHQVLRNAFFVVSDDMQNTPGTIEHRTLR